jgi:DNA-directed RNA polymerase specialized sigma24 family protein
MKTRVSPERTASRRQKELAASDSPSSVAEGSGGENGLEADGRLAERCVMGEVAAWEELYAQCHDPLCASIRAMLGPCSDANLVDEISARVWYALVAKDGELLARYSHERGARLSTYLRALAKHEMCRHLRTEVRRRKREFLAMKKKSPEDAMDLARSIHDLEGFLVTLTPRERGFWDVHLLATSPGIPYSPANIWQLTHRIYEKLMRFLNRGS